MATIVVHRPTGLRYVVVGSGYSEWTASTAREVLGDLIDARPAGSAALIAAADPSGRITWFETKDLLVVEVDGKSPQAWLADAPFR